MNIEKYLKTTGLNFEYYDTLGSTNSLLLSRAQAGAAEGTVIVARRQEAGRGRMGRSFFSPGGTGLYMSLLLCPDMPAQESLLITPCAAVAVAESIEAQLGLPAQIKWVNDVFVNGGKVCGILTEAVAEPGGGRLSHAVLGVGVNISAPESGFPQELEGVAAALLPFGDTGEFRARLAAEILDRFMNYYSRLSEKLFLEAYRSRSMLDGRRVWLLSRDGTREPALVIGVDDALQLVVETDDGRRKNVLSEEVKVRFDELMQ